MIGPMRFLIGLGITTAILATTVVIGGYVYLKPGLPDVESLRTVKLQTPLQIFTADRQLIAQFGEKHRDPVSINEVPLDLIRAFLAAEDDNFRDHVGIDPFGLARAAWQLVSSGQIQSGGSTITMQVAKNYFLTHERTFARKFREILLALEIEKTLTKDEILELYFNVIFLGHRAYGVNAAAQIYYGKNLDELTLAQSAMIAGLPKAPSKYNPIANPERAKERRDWILKRMLSLKFIEKYDFEIAIQDPVTASLHGVHLDLTAPYVAEEARRVALEIFDDRAYTDGLRVFTTIRGDYQRYAQNAVIRGLMDYDRRHGWRGAERTLSGTKLFDWKRQLKNVEEIGPLKPAVVVSVTEKTIRAVTSDEQSVTIEKDGYRWAREYKSVNSIGPEIKDARALVAPGDLIRVLRDKDKWWLAQKPEVESGFVALDPNTGAIQAMIGGFNYFESKFNRATQGGRLVGSGIKPLIYTAALESGMTPATLVNDAPVVFDQTEGATDWRPQNSGGTFLGPTRLRTALYRSRNLVSVRLVRELGVSRIIDIAERFGVDAAKLPRNLSISLGTASLTPLDMAEIYAIFANGGFQVKNHLIDRIESADGAVLYQTTPVSICKIECDGRPVSVDLVFDNRIRPVKTDLFEADYINRVAPRVIDERIHFLINDMLKDVVQRGTAKKAKSLKRSDLAGKTGTTNDQVDAWFNGYQKGIVASVWVGFDQPRTLGRSEFGGRAALPIWIEFMKHALKDIQEDMSQLPTGVVATRIDPETGAKARASQKDTMREYFLLENPPKEPLPETIIPANDGKSLQTPQQLF